MKEQIEEMRRRFQQELQEAETYATIEQLQVKYLGRKGPVQELMKQLKSSSSEERPRLGKLINDLKEEISQQLEKKGKEFLLREENARLEHEKIDVTLPGRQRFLGKKHILTHVLDRIIDIMIGMGFSVQYGPDIDTDYYNFEALNFDQDHPARDMQDTFYITSDILLRTHTSNIQARVMEMQKPPIRVVAPGKAYRNEEVTARSHVFFHQIEAFYVNKGVSFSDLTATLDEFLDKLFDPSLKRRYRPSYFPFVEPGLEVDVSCLACHGEGCPLCKHTGWVEIAGAGMVHPEVLRNGGIDPEEYSGYAWGMGIERLVMVRHGIRDIRTFTDNDQRFLRQFAYI
ncbi:MAG: phenylalanine--tRNA ligase subunit alpha [Chlamydiales bacterium]